MLEKLLELLGHVFKDWDYDPYSSANIQFYPTNLRKSSNSDPYHEMGFTWTTYKNASWFKIEIFDSFSRHYGIWSKWKQISFFL